MQGCIQSQKFGETAYMKMIDSPLFQPDIASSNFSTADEC